MTVDGLIIKVIPVGIEGYRMTGEITIETIGGMDGLGIIVPFNTATWIDIGEAVIGKMTMDGDILADMATVLGDMMAPVLVQVNGVPVVVVTAQEIDTGDK